MPRRIPFLKSEFSRNVFKLASGTTVAQAIPVIASLFLARLYSPEEIGAFSFFMSIVSLLTILTTCRFEQAIVLPKKNIDGIRLFYISIIINTFITIILFVSILFLKDIVASYANYPRIEPFLLLLPVITFFSGLHQSFNYWNNRQKTFKIIAYGKITRNLVMVIFQFILSFFHVGGLIIGKLIGEISAIIQYYLKSPKIEKLPRLNLRAELKVVFIDYIDFLKYTTPNSFLNFFSNNIPVLILPKLFNMEVTGYYSWSTRIIQTPMSIITTSIQQVFYQSVNAKYIANKSIFPIVKSTYKKLFLIGIIPYTIIFIFAPTIFTFLFGDEWRTAGEFTRYLIPWLFIMFLNSPVTSIILVLNKQKAFLKFEIILFSARLGALILGYLFFKTAHMTIMCYSFVGISFNIFLFFYLNHLAKNS